MNHLWEVETFEDIVDICKARKDIDEFFNSLYTQLTGKNRPNKQLETQLLVTIKSAKNTLMTVSFTEGTI
ncbi:MAG: hypothetical protein EOM41_08150 [Bacilli bacterium]|nr:hypothetical protein [Bacilli bacterium]